MSTMFQIRTARAAEFAEMFEAKFDLKFRGLRMEVDGDRLVFTQNVLDVLREERDSEADGFIEDMPDGPIMWVGSSVFHIEEAE